MKRSVISSLAVIAIAATSFAGSANAAGSSPGTQASFEGTTFDMSRGWGDATACSVTDTGTACYRTEAEMDRAIQATPQRSSCSSSLRLYDGTSKTGDVINISTRASVISLSTYGFDNKTSSYQVGACSSKLYSGIGSGQYPGSTSAGASANSMLSGWNNTVSSVLIP